MTRSRAVLLSALLALGAACEDSGDSRKARTPPPSSSTATVAGRCEHALPPALCTRCNPALAAVFQAKGDWCAEHGFPESFCPICHPNAPIPNLDAQPTGNEDSVIEARVVRFKSPEIEKTAGLATVKAERATARATVECTARIAFDGDKVADVRAILPGVVRRVRASLGDKVERGAPLFDLESTRVGEIQGALQTAEQRVRTAEANLARQRELLENEIASVRQVEVAEQELAAARSEAKTAEAALRMAGAARAAPSGRYTLTSPIAGTLVRRPAVVGVLATESTSLATVADTSVMWALCDVPERDASRVALKQHVTVQVDGADLPPLQGEITWIAAEVDPRTRTITARAEVPNPDGHLRANQFATARIETGTARAAVTVPRAAVQRVGDREVVFVRARPGVYQPRVVRRYGDGDSVQVEGKIEDGEEVVTTGAVLLRTEIMPGSIGAGCCEVD